MMTCDDWRAFAHDYVLGDLSEPARALLDAHAESCASCLGEARALQRVDRRLREDPVVAPPPDLAKRALEGFAVRRRSELWRVAAALLLAAGVGSMATLVPEDWSRVPGAMSKAARLVPTFLVENLEHAP
jgi:anti-sigma factor RsiW